MRVIRDSFGSILCNLFISREITCYRSSNLVAYPSHPYQNEPTN